MSGSDARTRVVVGVNKTEIGMEKKNNITRCNNPTRFFFFVARFNLSRQPHHHAPFFFFLSFFFSVSLSLLSSALLCCNFSFPLFFPLLVPAVYAAINNTKTIPVKH